MLSQVRINFFANKIGWACDNVASYEVVTASGVIVTATPTSFADLYWALRGGGSNFGIVTNFKLDAFPLGKMWGGQRIYTENNFPALLDAIYSFATTKSSQDTDAAEIMVCLHLLVLYTYSDLLSPSRTHPPSAKLELPSSTMLSLLRMPASSATGTPSNHSSLLLISTRSLSSLF